MYLETLYLQCSDIARSFFSEIDEEIMNEDEDSGMASATNQIFIGGLSPKISRSQLKQHFSCYGKITNIFISPNRGFGIVTFSTQESALLVTAQPIQFIGKVKIEVKPFYRKPRYGFLSFILLKITLLNLDEIFNLHLLA